MPVLHICRYAPEVHVFSSSSQRIFENKLLQNLPSPFPIKLSLLRGSIGRLQTGWLCLLWNVVVPSDAVIGDLGGEAEIRCGMN